MASRARQPARRSGASEQRTEATPTRKPGQRRRQRRSASRATDTTFQAGVVSGQSEPVEVVARDGSPGLTVIVLIRLDESMEPITTSVEMIAATTILRHCVAPCPLTPQARRSRKCSKVGEAISIPR